MEKLEFNSLKKYWNNYAEESQGNDPRDKTGSEKSRENPQPIPKPRTKKNVAISQNTSAKCTNNRLIHNAPLSATSYWSPDVSNGTTTILQHRQDVLKRCADEIASKKSTKCIDNLTTQYDPRSSTSFDSSDISRGTNRIAKSNEVLDESAKCQMTQNNHLPLTTMLALGSSDGTDSNSTTSEFDSDLDKRGYTGQMSVNRKLPYPIISRKPKALVNNKMTKVSENGNIMTKVMDTSTKRIHDSRNNYEQFNMETSTEVRSNTYSCIPVYNITSAVKRTPVDKQTPFDNQTPVEKGTLVDKHSKIDKPGLNRMEIRWNNCLKQQIDTDEKCCAEKVEENYPSILDRETLAKYHCKGARPKDSPFFNNSQSSLSNSDLAETSVRRNDETKGASCQSKCSSANPDLAGTNRQKSKVNLKFETSQKASHHVIAETTSRQREICHSMLPERNVLACQSNRSSVVEPLEDIREWLVKFPFEPQFVYMIKMGYENGFVYDTIVLTALCISTEFIFYRGENDQQKKVNELKKLKFCDAKGDAFTYLKIYKEWEQVPEGQKNKWCVDNALNSKSLRVARELVNEICSIFTNNLRIDVKQTFSTEVKFEETLRKIILFAFYENIAHFLGHVLLGYYIPNLQQRVFIHPSSAMYSLNDFSQWLVFINIQKTSRDYITVVTPVKESWIRWAKQFDIDEAKNRSVCSIRSKFFGSTAYSFFVGTDYSKLKEYEDLLYESVQVPVAIAPDRKTGEVKFICGFNATLPDDLIDNWIAEAKSHVMQRSAEYKVGSNDQTRVRIVLGLGGEGQMILMPDEYRTVHIKAWNKKTSKDSVEDKFKRFGQIAYCREDKDKQSHNRWGRVTFSTPEAAAEAVRRTQDDPKDAAAPEFKIRKHASFQYQATIEWLRRRPTGIVFVEMGYLHAMSLKSRGEVQILGQSCGISLDKKKPNTVRLDKVPTMVTEQEIHSCFPHHLITKIIIKREKPFSHPNELSNFQQQIHDQFQELYQDMKFAVDVMMPRDSHINFRAFIKFNDVSQGTMACDALRGSLTINGQETKITPTLSTSLSVPEQVYQLLENKIDDFLAESKENGTEFRLDMKKFNNERRVFHISASNPNELMQIRKGLSAITHGEVIEYNENNRYLFLKSGRDILRSLEERTNTIFQLDNRQLTLRVFGMQNNIFLARKAIDQYRQNILEGDRCREIKLDGESQPKGLMKTLVTRYDIELEGFVEMSGLQSTRLNHRNQTLKICGDSASMDKAIGLIESVAAELRNTTTVSQSEELPDCCACFIPVKSLDHKHVCRLDACGHVYCLECIKLQIALAVQRKELPVLCADCQDPLVWSDFTRLRIKPSDLVSTAMSVFMTKNKDGYRYCPTPDCPMVYRCTKKSDIFNCNECESRICTSCHVEYHDGLTCEILKSSMEDLQFEKYLKENASRVKKCPKCSILIEKDYGCNLMICKSCKIHFCWLCCETFTTQSATYDHLNAHHNGIFAEEDLLHGP